MEAEFAPDAWNLRARVRRAIRYLGSLAEDELARVVWSRMIGVEDPSLPRFERDEHPADIFIDVVLQGGSENDYLARSIKRVSARIIAEQAGKEALPDLSAAAEMLFLAARIQAEEAINPVYAIAIHPEAGEVLSTGETLQARSLRVLLGLLIAFPVRASEAHRATFEELKLKTECTLTCLTALIAIFHEDRERLMKQVRDHGIRVRNKELDLHLSVLDMAAPTPSMR